MMIHQLGLNVISRILRPHVADQGGQIDRYVDLSVAVGALELHPADHNLVDGQVQLVAELLLELHAPIRNGYLGIVKQESNLDWIHTGTVVVTCPWPENCIGSTATSCTENPDKTGHQHKIPHKQNQPTKSALINNH